MTDMTRTLKLINDCDEEVHFERQVKRELLRLVSTIERLDAQLYAVGAGGVSGPVMAEIRDDAENTTNIDSPMNACMYQAACKRFKAQAGLQHQHESRRINDLATKTSHSVTSSSTVPTGWKLVPVEPTIEMIVALMCSGLRHAEYKKGCDPTSDHMTDGYRAMLDAAPQPPVVEQHTDDAAVNRFAEAMKAKLAVARDKGRGGWDDPAQCTVEYLAKLLVDHIAKGDPIDVANFAMMLHQRQADKSVLSAAAPTPPAVDHPEPAYLLRDLADDISVDALDLIAAIRDAGLGNYSINMKLPTRVCVAMCQKFSDAQQPQVEQEPVAVVDFTTEGWRKIVDALRTLPDGAQLYTRPQPRREPLTRERIKAIQNELSDTVGCSYETMARAVERAHGIGGEV